MRSVQGQPGQGCDRPPQSPGPSVGLVLIAVIVFAVLTSMLVVGGIHVTASPGPLLGPAGLEQRYHHNKTVSDLRGRVRTLQKELAAVRAEGCSHGAVLKESPGGGPGATGGPPTPPTPPQQLPAAPSKNGGDAGRCAALLTANTAWTKRTKDVAGRSGAAAATDQTEWAWSVSADAQLACNTQAKHLNLRQSSAKLMRQNMSGRWVLFMGDSSTRMLYDYFVGRMLGDWSGWPSTYNNHGPKHTYAAGEGQDGEGTTEGEDRAHWYDTWHNGARVTFVWTSKFASVQLRDIMRRSIGRPSIVFAQVGYWLESKVTDNTGVVNDILQSVDQWVNSRELQFVFRSAYDQKYLPVKVLMTMFHNG
eukprot:SAG22_NODE_2302_length_2738_cov_3.010610_3_plen_363_part_00